MSRSPAVIAVGGSLAGCATALHLANLGHEVLVLDRASFPREKVCGEGLMPSGVEALRALGLLSEVRAISHPFQGVAYHVPGASATGRFPGGRVGLGVRRRALDVLMQRACRAHPRVTLETGVRVRSVSREGSHMEVRSTTERWSCRAVVGADGLHSKVRHQLGLSVPARGPVRYGARAHFDVGEDLAFVEVHVLEEAELYLTPVGEGRLNIAVLCHKDFTRTLEGDLTSGFMRLIRSSPRVRELVGDATPLTQPSLCGPLRQSVSSAATAGAVLVGDAAGFVDAITGEGMSLTLRSAEIAAEVLSEALHRDALGARDLAVYSRRRHRAGRDMTWLTEGVLWGLRQRWLARRVVRSLDAHPQLFSRILAVNSGHASLSSIGVGGVATLLRG